MEYEEKRDFRFWFDGRKIEGMSWLKSEDLPEYKPFDYEFILVKRDFGIPEKEVISDDDILRENLKDLFSRVYSKDKADFDIFDEVKRLKR